MSWYLADKCVIYLESCTSVPMKLVTLKLTCFEMKGKLHRQMIILFTAGKHLTQKIFCFLPGNILQEKLLKSLTMGLILYLYAQMNFSWKKICLIHRTCVLTWICSKPHSNVNEFGLFYISNSKPKVSNLHKTHPNHAHIRACYTLFPFSTPTTWHSLKTHFHLTDVQQDTRAMPSLSSQQVQKHRESFYTDPDWKHLISQLYIWIHVSLHLLAAQLIIMYIQPTYIFAFHKFHKRFHFRTKVIDFFLWKIVYSM